MERKRNPHFFPRVNQMILLVTLKSILLILRNIFLYILCVYAIIRHQMLTCKSPDDPAIQEAVSSTLTARNPPQMNSRHGRILRTTLTTLSFRSRNVASMGKDMKNVWIELHLSISRPSPLGKRLVPISPFALSKNVRATFARTPSISTVSNLLAAKRFRLRIAVDKRRYGVHYEDRERHALGITAT